MKKSIEGVELESLEVSGLGLATKGLAVAHPLFGSGKIVAFFALSNGMKTIGVEFESFGYKALVPEYAKLTLQGPAGA